MSHAFRDPSATGLARRLLLALTVSLMGACAGEDGRADDGAAPRAAEPSVVRPRLMAGAEAASVSRELVTVARLNLLAGQEGGPEEGIPWSVEAPVWGPGEPTWLFPGAAPPMLLAAARRREVPITYRLLGPLDLTDVQQLAIVGSARGAGGLGVLAAFVRDGKEVLRLPAAKFTQHQPVELLTLPIPHGALVDPVVDELVLRIPGHDRKVGLAEVLLQRVPPAASLPTLVDGPSLVTVDGVARSALPLVAGRPLSAALPAFEGGRLELALGQPEGAAHGGPLDVTVDTGRGQPWRGRVSAAEGWVSLSLPWDGAAGRLTVSAQGAPGAALAVSAPVLHRPVEAPPTVLLITSDTHRADHLGVSDMGVEVATPWLDGLAERGLRFSDCFAPINNTNPSHVALMTATHPRDTGVLDNYRPITEVPLTLAEAFAGAGWATLAASSSKHLGPSGSGLGQGFDAVAWSTVTGQRDSSETLAALEPLLDEAEGRPLFLWVHLFDAHTPYEPPEAYTARYYDLSRDPFDPALGELPVPAEALPPELRRVRDLELPFALYKGEVTYLDDQLARLTSWPRLGDAVTAVVADHGESHGENGGWFTHAGVYSASLHIPLILAGPGVPVGRVERRPVQHLGLGRTLLDLAGLEAVAFPGRSLLAEAARPAPRFAVEANGASAAVTMDGLHLVLHLIVRDVPSLQESHPRHAVELFDLSVDPRCADDLADERPQTTRRLRRLLIDWLGAASPKGWVGSVETDAAALETLAQLGYAGPAGEGSANRLWAADDCDQCRRWEGP